MTNDPGSPAAQPSAGTDTTPAAVAGYRERLSRGEDVIDLETWAGSLPAAHGIAPRVRVGRSRWFNLLWLLPAGCGVLLVAVAAAQGLRNMPAVQRFLARYPGPLTSPGTHPGLPWWVDAQHFLNALFMIFIIRAGIQILADHARLYWTRHSTPGRDWFRFQKPVPEDPLWTAKQDSVSLPGQVGLPGLRHSIGLARWWHLGTDMLWLANGAVFYALLFSTGEWHRIVPTTWKVFPSAVSVLIRPYAQRADQGRGASSGLPRSRPRHSPWPPWESRPPAPTVWDILKPNGISPDRGELGRPGRTLGHTLRRAGRGGLRTPRRSAPSQLGEEVPPPHGISVRKIRHVRPVPLT